MFIKKKDRTISLDAIMRKPESAKLSSAGFGLIDVVIILFVLSLIAFVVITNILAHNY